MHRVRALPGEAGWRSNNLDLNARHCMASSAAGTIQAFGTDEPPGRKPYRVVDLYHAGGQALTAGKEPGIVADRN